MLAAFDLARQVGSAAACRALAVPRASYYRSLQPKAMAKLRPTPARALSAEEKQTVLDQLHSARFCDKAPAEVYATLLDEGIYLCSVRTMHRILAEQGELRERRNQLRHPQYKKPELLAQRPCEVWSWDITKLLGQVRWSYFHLYVIMDIFSRYVVGWMVAPRETAVLASRLIAETCAKQGVAHGTLTIHADRGTSMTSRPVALLMADPGITKTHSRPHVSDDNPYSESHFKTLKYRPEFPDRFGSIEDARAFCQRFFTWYNQQHRHREISMLTPQMLHYGTADAVIAQRQKVLSQAYACNPNRFVRNAPTPMPKPTEVWINKPAINADPTVTRADSCH